MEQRLERRDWRLIAACVAIIAVSMAAGSHYFYRAFPEATIDFEITRDEARSRARSFLEHRGFDVEGYRHSSIFEFSNLTKTFLERQLGLEGASRVIGNPVRLWRWSSRWVKELHKEEFRVQYTTRGELVGFSHRIEEDDPGASLEQAAARQLAERFLVHTIGQNLTDLEYVGGETIYRPHRLDHSFAWKLKGFHIDGATYRFGVEVQGDLVGGFDEFLAVPDEWQRRFRNLTSRNETTRTGASSLLILTWVAMLVSLVTSIRGRDVRWRPALIFGGVSFTLTFLSQLNMLPVADFGFDTRATFGGHYTDQLLSALLAGLGSGIVIAFVVAAAEPVYRQRYGDHISLTEQFLVDGLRTRRFFLGTVIGLTLTVAFMAYTTIFHLIAGRLGAWAPADIPYREMVNTHMPWVVVLLAGFFPAVLEELTSRAFSIPFLERYLKRRWVAVLVSAAIWGFAHASYPQQPFYLRGIELGIAGIAFGYVMLRWGLLPVLICHYTVDALWTAMVLLRSSNSYFVISAALSVGLMLLPLGISIAYYLRHQYFLDPTSLLNREHLTPQVKPLIAMPADLGPEARLLERLPGSQIPYALLSPRRLLLAGALVLASYSVFWVEVDDPAEPVAITRDQAEEIALAHLSSRGIDVASYRTVVSHQVNVDTSATRYRLQRGGVAALKRLHRDCVRPGLWRVRLYRPLEQGEYRAFIDPGSGAVHSVTHLLDENAEGADLSQAEALHIAQGCLRAHDLQPGDFELKDVSSEKLKSRRDHRFVWEARQGDRRNLDESRYRCSIQVAGDEPVMLRRWVTLPESWLRDREGSTVLRSVLRWSLVVAGILVTLHLACLAIRQLRETGVAWQAPLIFGAIAAALSLAAFINNAPTLHADYATEIAPAIFYAQRLLALLAQAICAALLVAIGIGVTSTLFPDCLTQLSAPARGSRLRDGLLVALLVWLGSHPLARLQLIVADRLAPYASPPDLPPAPGLDTFLPLWSGLEMACVRAIAVPVVAAIGIYYATRVLGRSSFVIAAAALLGVAWAGAGAYSGGEFYLRLVVFLGGIGISAAVIAFLMRDNALAYVLVGIVPPALGASWQLLSQTATAYRHNGITLAVATAVLVALLWLTSRRTPPAR